MISMHLLSPESITAGGLLVIAFIVFAESGLLFGFFFPGDTLLLLSGVLASQGKFNLALLLIVISTSATLGGQVGYYLGKKYGPKIFSKKDGVIFKQEYIQKSEKFYENHGGKTIMLARFVPIIRTFAPVVAGVGKMNYKVFTIYNIVGSIVWGVTVTLIGYFFGSRIPNLDQYITMVVVGVVVLSFAPIIYHIIANPNSRRTILNKLRLG